MTLLPRVLDAVLEGPIAPSFTRAGYDLRSRAEGWTDLANYDVAGRVIVLTGATSGLGLAAAHRIATAGTHLVIIGRNPEKTERVRGELDELGEGEVDVVIADMGELDEVAAAADRILDRHAAIDALLHNAGTLTANHTTNRSGLEATVASQVVGPHLLTRRLLDALDANDGRVITMSSGGMYSAGLTVSQLLMDPADYGGSEQYARAKRAQVTLNEMWPTRIEGRAVTFHALHPGWADTPGVEAALPTFRKIVGPALRTADQGADTMVWLTLDDGEPLESSGDFWHDRRRRSIHKLPTTRRTDTPERRAALWAWVEEQSDT